MIGYFMTKPIQGSIFKKFRDMIIGVIPIKNDIEQIKESEFKKKSKWIFGPWKQEERRDCWSVLIIIHPCSKY